MRDVNDWTIIQLASLKGFDEIVQILIEKGANVNSENRYKATALHALTYNGNFDKFNFV